ncbi:MAG: phosphohydrolase, partial [Streptosporangiaceae bacterium]
MTTQRHLARQSAWQSTDSGQLLLVIAAGMLLVAAVAQTAAAGLVQPRDALAFGALIALGELLRLSLPGDREAAPIGSAGALGYALAVQVGTQPAMQPALQVVAVTAVGMIVGALPHLAAGRAAGGGGRAARTMAVAFVGFPLLPP